MNESNDHENEETPMESLRWLETEFANHVGFTVTLKTYEQDYIYGRIVGVRTGGVCLIDEHENRIYCDLGIIALYCIINPKTKDGVSRKDAEKRLRKPRAAQPKKPEPPKKPAKKKKG